MIPQNTTDPAGDDLERLQKILDMLDDLDDVSEVYHNANLPEEEEETNSPVSLVQNKTGTCSAFRAGSCSAYSLLPFPVTALYKTNSKFVL